MLMVSLSFMGTFIIFITLSFYGTKLQDLILQVTKDSDNIWSIRKADQGIKCQKSGDSMFCEIRPKKLVLPPTLNRSSSVKHGLAKFLTFYFTARDRPLSKPHGPWTTGVGGP